ncbi:hypothetical protein Vi05172_g8844 [Venturia inaequalis]|uniref:Secreted protein n=1 Tax=Venturia inaequalis TaxID=5025 RepID=A0A8H3UN61_VENIN|nr:hypothetical protein EG327_009096 [Venturia inaequalis]RDI81180.1 hypothetical protein Vi05172_g8844 [Venturia inaequalis]
MQFQTLLPAILFAQSSFAYTCCFEYVGKGDFAYAEYLGSGGLQVWRPTGSPTCEIMINKSGKSCADWKHSIAQNSCASSRPYRHIGVTEAGMCSSTYGA